MQSLADLPYAVNTCKQVKDYRLKAFGKPVGFLLTGLSKLNLCLLSLCPSKFSPLLGVLALYLGFSPASEWITNQLSRWFNFAERSLYLSEEEFEDARPVRESINALYASALSIVPVLVLGIGLNYGVEVGLGSSWTISMGILACISCGVYELGRRDGQIGS